MTPEQLATMEAMMPPAIRSLPRDGRSYPIPWFVTDPPPGQPPDLRVADARKRVLAYRENWCWVCGVPLGRMAVFVSGPLSVANGVSGDWCCHERCAEFAARFCPALDGTMARRPGKEVPDGTVSLSGHIDALPALVAVVYAGGKVRLDRDTNLFLVPRCRRVRWFSAGEELTPGPARDLLTAHLSPHGFDAADVRLVLAGKGGGR